MNSSDDGFGIQNSTSSTDWKDQAVFPEYRAGEIIKKIFAPCILAVGTFGNIATICVMRRIKDHNSSQHAILMTLAVSDFLLILTGMSYRLLWYYFHVDLRVWHSLVCRLYYWLLYVTNTQSAWLVTCVTVQRAMSIIWPHKMRAVCTLRRTWVAIASIVVTTCLIHGHFLVWREINSENRCVAGTEAYFRFLITWAWVDMFLSSFLPSLCQIACDVILCLALFKAASAMSTTVHATSDANAEHDRTSRRKTASKITVLCLVLSCTFLILTLPVCIEEVWYYSMYLTLTPRSEAKRWLQKNIFTLMWYSNSAVNFFLYCITGTKFRKEFLNCMCCRTQRHSTASVGDVTAGVVEGRKQ